MRNSLKFWCAALLGLGLVLPNLRAQTDGEVRFQVTLGDYNGSSTKHWTVVWIATASGTFIKTLWRQGPSITASHWSRHCGVWYDAKSGSTAFDGYSSATARTYSGVNNPVILTWDCRDAANHLVADGTYKFWVQYAEDSGQGPSTTSGLLWTKGPNAVVVSPPNQGNNFTNMRITWTPAGPPPTPPTITSVAPPATGTVGVPYHHACTATGTTPIHYWGPGLPPGLAISPDGEISGIPVSSGTFSGNIMAVNGVSPNAMQPFSITISVVPTTISTVTNEGSHLVLRGTGPANGVYTVLAGNDLMAAPAQWTALLTNTFDPLGRFSYTNALEGVAAPRYYRLRIP